MSSYTQYGTHKSGEMVQKKKYRVSGDITPHTYAGADK